MTTQIKELKRLEKTYNAFFESLVNEILKTEEMLKKRFTNKNRLISNEQYADSAGRDITWTEYYLSDEYEEELQEEAEDAIAAFFYDTTPEKRMFDDI